MFCHQRKRHDFGLTDGAAPQPRWGHGELSPEVTGHQLARERDTAGGFLTLIFPAHPSASYPKTFCRLEAHLQEQSALRVSSRRGRCLPCQMQAGFEFPAAGARGQLRSGAQAKGKGWGEGKTFAREGFGCHPLACSRLVRSPAVARAERRGWCGGSAQAHARLLLPHAASLCFGFAPGFRRWQRIYARHQIRHAAGAGGSCLGSILMPCLADTWVQPALKTRRCRGTHPVPRRLLPLTNDRLPAMQLGFRSHPIPCSRARGRGKAVSLSLLHLLEGCSTATAFPKPGQAASQLGWRQADPCWHPVLLPTQKHAQNPPA